MTVIAENAGTQHERTLGITSCLLAELERLHSESGGHPDETVFGVKCDFTSSWEGAVRQAGLTDIRFHDLRHCFVSRLVAHGMSAAAVVHQDARASLRNVEHLANLLCRMTDSEWYEAESQGGVLTQEAQKKRLIQLRNSSEQLQWLLTLRKTSERLSLRARVHKSLALIDVSFAARQCALVRAGQLYKEASDLDVAEEKNATIIAPLTGWRVNGCSSR